MDSRLQHIAKLSSPKSTDAFYVVVDCGCDHGKVLYWLLKNYENCHAVAIDRSAPSLDKARKLLELFKDRVTFHCADGLTCLGDRAYDTLIISGIGGCNTIDILTVSKVKFARMILSPHRDIELVKQWLKNNNYNCIETTVLCKAKTYTILNAHIK